ncbi:MAG TPA: heparan-alpha-glucosaminide N-acetyltransferase domain-containing protein [Bryobacteraceae bacterium]|nr:heparan-alpha-glucosaminide N-acetyltransferase domain-containing protein [Bryobacteraceae bacterium]
MRVGATRNESIDLLRGLVMVIMTVDHVREYSGAPGQVPLGDPVDLSNVTPLLFVLRWLAHFCAPVFAFLMGVSASFSGSHRSPVDRRKHLIGRGLILIALELTIVNWSWTFNPLWHRYFFQVIGALGVAMICLGLASGWPRRVTLLAGIILAAGHNAFDSVRFEPNTWMHYVWSFLHQKNVLPLVGDYEIRTTYPVVSVVALALCGYGIGHWFRDPDSPQYSRRLMFTGLALCALFFVLRLTNLYGDAGQFQGQATWLYTLFSIGNTTKYPMSLQYMLMTIGPAMLLLAAKPDILGETVKLLGRVPMFYYVAHLLAAHLLVWSMALLNGYPVSSLNVVDRYGGIPQGFGFPLWASIPLSFVLIFLLLPACRRYATLRESGTHRWTSWI